LLPTNEKAFKRVVGKKLADTVQAVDPSAISFAVCGVLRKGDRTLYMELSRAKAVIVKLQAM
jgi:hypothetical protein